MTNFIFLKFQSIFTHLRWLWQKTFWTGQKHFHFLLYIQKFTHKCSVKAIEMMNFHFYNYNATMTINMSTNPVNITVPRWLTVMSSTKKVTNIYFKVNYSRTIRYPLLTLGWPILTEPKRWPILRLWLNPENIDYWNLRVVVVGGNQWANQ